MRLASSELRLRVGDAADRERPTWTSRAEVSAWRVNGRRGPRREVVASASGRLWSFVDGASCGHILGQLIAAELLQMSLAELFDRAGARPHRPRADARARSDYRVKKPFFGGGGGGAAGLAAVRAPPALWGSGATFFRVTRKRLWLFAVESILARQRGVARLREREVVRVSGAQLERQRRGAENVFARRDARAIRIGLDDDRELRLLRLGARVGLGRLLVGRGPFIGGGLVVGGLSSPGRRAARRRPSPAPPGRLPGAGGAAAVGRGRRGSGAGGRRRGSGAAGAAAGGAGGGAGGGGGGVGRTSGVAATAGVRRRRLGLASTAASRAPTAPAARRSGSRRRRS